MHDFSSLVTLLVIPQLSTQTMAQQLLSAPVSPRPMRSLPRSCLLVPCRIVEDCTAFPGAMEAGPNSFRFSRDEAGMELNLGATLKYTEYSTMAQRSWRESMQFQGATTSRPSHYLYDGFLGNHSESLDDLQEAQQVSASKCSRKRFPAKRSCPMNSENVGRFGQ